ncbi:VOC family protein [Teredinibacter haidensis]|uniref:VOC family protein n=1 Tax=Teredinibacter haidensis TaxID=2731755 RepID=UPI0009490584|nr:VOC family protein [Teredinibacter haidensis]
MKIEHIAIWATNIEELKAFYEKYFDAKANNKYVNSRKGFQSYFLSFSEGSRLELMQMDSIPGNANDILQQYKGIIHFAVSVGSRGKVDELTRRLKLDGYAVLDGPRETGDGYYESLVLDAEKNRVEITV